jgi:hypothetical protein
MKPGPTLKGMPAGSAYNFQNAIRCEKVEIFERLSNTILRIGLASRELSAISVTSRVVDVEA